MYGCEIGCEVWGGRNKLLVGFGMCMIEADILFWFASECSSWNLSDRGSVPHIERPCPHLSGPELEPDLWPFTICHHPKYL